MKVSENMKRKILMFLICGVMVIGLTTGCGSKDSKESSSGNITFDYSKMNTTLLIIKDQRKISQPRYLTLKGKHT